MQRCWPKSRDSDGVAQLAIGRAAERILALLAVAYGKTVGPKTLGGIRRAATEWSRGETCLAQIHLARCGLPRLPDDEEAPFRLFLGDEMLAEGLTPRELVKACGLALAPFDLLKAGFNPDQPRTPASNPDGGRWTSDDDPATSRPDEPARSLLMPANYTLVHGCLQDARMVIPPDGIPIPDKDSPTKTLMAPPSADFRQVSTAGQEISSLPLSEQYPRVRAAIAQEGTYDFQRDVPNQKFYDAYTPAANYAVGVYMAAAGYSLDTTRALAKLYALRHSGNYNTQDQLEWIKRGWTDATSGRWR